MCSTCGCSDPNNGYIIYKPGSPAQNLKFSFAAHSPENHAHQHVHPHSNDHLHQQVHEHAPNEQIIAIEQDILRANNLMAERNRGYFEAKDIFSLNLVSSPGSGKTSLLERTIKELAEKCTCYVIEGDQQTDNDAVRIAATGAAVLQINTGNACHLDSEMVHKALHQLKPVNGAVVFIENVGNLVCPAMFDLGEKSRVVIFSVTEGEDKPLKYPYMFHSSNICIISKTDLLPHLDFNLNLARENVQKVNPHAQIFELSVKSGQGMEQWINWVLNNK